MRTQVSTKVWLDLGEGVAFCHGKADLLAAIESCGSINRAAEQLGMSYKRAWQYLRQLERRLGEKVLDTSIGGVGGGGSRLTEAGRDLLTRYGDAKRQVQESLAQSVGAYGGTI